MANYPPNQLTTQLTMSLIDILINSSDTERTHLLGLLKKSSYKSNKIELSKIAMIDLFVSAIMENDSDLMHEYLPYIDNINNTDSTYNSTPIMFAAQNGNVEIVKFLLANGASIADDTIGNKSALYFALSNNTEGNYECATILIKAGAEIEGFVMKSHANKYSAYGLYLVKKFVKDINENTDKNDDENIYADDDVDVVKKKKSRKGFR